MAVSIEENVDRTNFLIWPITVIYVFFNINFGNCFAGSEMFGMPQMDQINLYIRLSDVKEVSAFATKRKFSNNNTLAFEVIIIVIY